MRRREFIVLFGTAVTWPIGARAQQTSVPAIGYLSNGSEEQSREDIKTFEEGLTGVGYENGKNLKIEYRFMDGRSDLHSRVISEFLQNRVDVIVAAGSTPAVVAKKMTSTVPIVFFSGGDPVELGLVGNLNRPGGNATGLSRLSHPVGPKRLQVTHELLPPSSIIGVLMNPNNVSTPGDRDEYERAANELGRKIKVIEARNDSEIDAAFETAAREQLGAVLVGAGAFFVSRTKRMVDLAARYGIPAVFTMREAVLDGGLMSYGPSVRGGYRQIGIYVGRILKGEKPSDLPVQQSTEIELVINLKTANALGIQVPLSLSARADEVIE
jgi:putative tryptophan/tyrosine transport system substrate-binding protein